MRPSVMRVSRALASSSSSGMAASMIMAGMPFLPKAARSSSYMLFSALSSAAALFEFAFALARVLDGVERLLHARDLFQRAAFLGAALADLVFAADRLFDLLAQRLDLGGGGGGFLLLLVEHLQPALAARFGVFQRGLDIRHLGERHVQIALAAVVFGVDGQRFAGGGVRLGIVTERVDLVLDGVALRLKFLRILARFEHRLDDLQPG